MEPDGGPLLVDDSTTGSDPNPDGERLRSEQVESSDDLVGADSRLRREISELRQRLEQLQVSIDTTSATVSEVLEEVRDMRENTFEHVVRNWILPYIPLFAAVATSIVLFIRDPLGRLLADNASEAAILIVSLYVAAPILGIVVFYLSVWTWRRHGKYYKEHRRIKTASIAVAWWTAMYIPMVVAGSLATVNGISHDWPTLVVTLAATTASVAVWFLALVMLIPVDEFVCVRLGWKPRYGSRWRHL